MIKPNELRLGNWAYDANNLAVKIIGIEYEYNHCLWEQLGVKCLSSCDFLNPIPLTKKMLVKCGFSEYEFEEDIFLHDEEDVCVQKSGKVYYPFSFENNDTIGEPIRYLHQLQNLFFALTGKELEVKL